LFFGLKAVDQAVKRSTCVGQQPFADSVQFIKEGILRHRHHLRRETLQVQINNCPTPCSSNKR
jgi:hypothetical protein